METLLSYSLSDLLLFSGDTYRAVLALYLTEYSALLFIFLIMLLGYLVTSPLNPPNRYWPSKNSWLIALTLLSLVVIEAFYLDVYSMINPYANLFAIILLLGAPILVLTKKNQKVFVASFDKDTGFVQKTSLLAQYPSSVLLVILTCSICPVLLQESHWEIIISPSFFVLLIIYSALLNRSRIALIFTAAPFTIFVMETTTLHLLSHPVWQLILALILNFIAALIPKSVHSDHTSSDNRSKRSQINT